MNAIGESPGDAPASAFASCFLISPSRLLCRIRKNCGNALLALFLKANLSNLNNAPIQAGRDQVAYRHRANAQRYRQAYV